MLAASTIWERLGSSTSLELLEQMHPGDTLVRDMHSFWTSDLQEDKIINLCYFKAAKVVAIC